MTRPTLLIASFDRVPSSKGASQHILRNALHLERHFHISLLTLGQTPLSRYPHMVVPLHEPNWLRRALAFRQHVRDTVALNPFDAYHVRSLWEGFAIPPDAELVYEVNGLPSIELPYRFHDLSRRPDLLERLHHHECAMLDRASRVMTPSRITRDYLIRNGADPDRTHIVPNAPSFPVPEQLPEAAPEAETLRLVYIGTLHEWQGLDTLLRALEPITRPWHLTLLTGARRDRRKVFLRHARKRGLDSRITLLDAVDHASLLAELRQHHIALAPLAPCSRNLVQGCMPIKLLDYMAAGLPIIAPDMPVVRDVTGPAYPLYRRYGRVALTDALGHAMADADWRANTARIGWEHVRAHFSLAHQRDALLEAYGLSMSSNASSSSSTLGSAERARTPSSGRGV